MRSLIPIAVWSLASAATAQPLTAPPAAGRDLQTVMDLQLRLDALQAQQDLAERQAMIAEGRATALEAQRQSERALADLSARTAAAPSVRPSSPIDLGPLASMPDAALADSDAKVRAAADNRR